MPLFPGPAIASQFEVLRLPTPAEVSRGGPMPSQRRANSGGGGRSGFIHWITAAQFALSTSC